MGFFGHVRLSLGVDLVGDHSKPISATSQGLQNIKSSPEFVKMLSSAITAIGTKPYKAFLVRADHVHLFQ